MAYQLIVLKSILRLSLLIYYGVLILERNVTEPRVPAYLPLFCIVIAVSAFSAVLWSFFRRRRNFTDIEEANFEFYHMTVIQGLNYRRQDPITVKMVAQKAKHFWGFCRGRAYRKIKDVLWHQTPQCDENEMQDVTERLQTSTTRSYNTTGITSINS